jgi:hypothetical protein
MLSLVPSFHSTVTLPSWNKKVKKGGCVEWVVFSNTHLIPKVRGLRHVTEQPDLNNTREHLDLCQNLSSQREVSHVAGGEKKVREKKRCQTYHIWLLHDLPVERCVYDEVAVVGDDGSSFSDRHAQSRVRGSEEVVQVLQHLGVRERDDFDRHPGFSLGGWGG